MRSASASRRRSRYSPRRHPCRPRRHEVEHRAVTVSATFRRAVTGDGIGLNFGIGVGVALNEALSLSMGCEHIFVLPSSINGQRISGAATDIGTFNFGLSDRLSERSSLNIGLGIGATSSAPTCG